MLALNPFNLRSLWGIIFVAVVALFAFVGCASDQIESAIHPDLSLGKKIGEAVVAACPVTDSGDRPAREQCAEKLANLSLLRNHMSTEFLWGQQQEEDNLDPKKNHTTIFDPLVWRKMYLSTFMFTDRPSVEQTDSGLTVIHLPVQFRNKLDEGDFPYPFWHDPQKWEAYQQAKEVMLVMQDGQITGALRSLTKDTSRQLVDKEWDGKWGNPRVTLFTSLFSPSNPMVPKLDKAYREFEVSMRGHTCLVCHSPDNANRIPQLLLLNYPNQALTLRHETLRQIKEKLMPPPNGIEDEAERAKITALADKFAKLGDQAFAYEGETADGGA